MIEFFDESDSLPPVIFLLSLLELILGPTWAWLGSGENPGTAAITGGAVVIAALAFNEAIGLYSERTRTISGRE